MKFHSVKLSALLCILCISHSAAFADESMSFTENLCSLQGHRFVEIRGAAPVFPVLTSHGMVQSFVVGVSDAFGEIFSNGGDYDSTEPKLATDLNITFFTPIADYRLGIMGGAVFDTWETTVYKDTEKTEASDETYAMNFYYVGLHFDYGHWVFSNIGTRLAIYGELCFGWLHSDDGIEEELRPCFDVCPFGLMFCPEKNIGIYFECPHIGARPFFQAGVSIGF